MTGTSGRQRARSEVVAAYQVTRPDDGLWPAFAAAIHPLLQRIMAGEEEARTVAAIRDTLQPELISGELRVRDAEQVLEA